MDVAIGVDSHKGSLAAASVDRLGRVLEIKEIPNDANGHRAAGEWIGALSGDVVVGIEGSGSYGAALARALLAAGIVVVEVPAHMTHRERKKAPSRGKSDPSDAVAIARVTARDHTLPRIAASSVLEDLKLLSDRYDQLKRAHTATINRIHKHLVVARPGCHRQIGKLATKKARWAVLALLRGDHSVRAELVRQDIAEVARLERAIAAVVADIGTKIAESGTTLTQLTGVGAISAAKILGQLSGRGRVRSKAAFAMLNGTAPIPASSGAQTHHRLNRGGNRQLNYALHMMALARLRHDDDTKAYVARRQMEGKSDKEAVRCLKRHLSNVVFRRLVEDVKGLPQAA
jgi:transposase